MVTRTVTMVGRQLLLYDKIGKSNIELYAECDLRDKKWKEKLDENFVLLEILEEHKFICKLSMTDDEFYKMAEKKVVESEDNE